MKILFVGVAHPYRGGLATFNERLCQELQQMGHQVEIFTFTVQYPQFLFPGKTQFTEAPPPSGLSISREVNSMLPLNWWQVGNQISKMSPDLLLFKFWLPLMGPCFGTIARYAKKNKHTRVVAILDNVVPHEKRLGDVAFTKYFLKQCDAFITMSGTVSNDLKSFMPGKPFTEQAHPLYDNFGEAVSKQEALAHLGLDASCRYALFFGFIRKYKGLDLLLQAMADERIRAMPVKLIVAGEFYDDPKPYQQMIAEHRLEDHLVLRTDFIAEEEVKYFFSAAEVVVQPYRSATQSGVTQIAYQFNRPMIVTNVGGLPQLVPDGIAGMSVPPDVNRISGALADFFGNNLAEKFAKGVADERLKFSWHTFAQSVLDAAAWK